MAVKIYKPITPGTRGMTGYTFEEITKSTPERSLLISPRRFGGRNSYGRITVRHRGGGNRRFIRIVDYKRDKLNIPAHVIAVEYDPNRTARIALTVNTPTPRVANTDRCSRRTSGNASRCCCTMRAR